MKSVILATCMLLAGTTPTLTGSWVNSERMLKFDGKHKHCRTVFETNSQFCVYCEFDGKILKTVSQDGDEIYTFKYMIKFDGNDTMSLCGESGDGCIKFQRVK